MVLVGEKVGPTVAELVVKVTFTITKVVNRVFKCLKLDIKQTKVREWKRGITEKTLICAKSQPVRSGSLQQTSYGRTSLFFLVLCLKHFKVSEYG